ncbi:MAG: sigma-70 family RNA polymerase sigma factor [Clostridia bacterium]|nr:sigma-70 family RNA polymerase sigma factor [Clostridia bacterium]
MDEKTIISLLKEKDEKGLDAFLYRYGPLIRYISSPILPDERDSEEAVSQISLLIWKNIASFDSEKGSFTAWLTTVSRNTALNLARKNKNAPLFLEDENVPSFITPEEELLKKERKELIKKALSFLSEKDRALFYRKYYYLQSTAQIARELSLSERAVEGRLYRIKKRLQKILGGVRHE